MIIWRNRGAKWNRCYKRILIIIVCILLPWGLWFGWNSNKPSLSVKSLIQSNRWDLHQPDPAFPINISAADLKVAQFEIASRVRRVTTLCKNYRMGQYRSNSSSSSSNELVGIRDIFQTRFETSYVYSSRKWGFSYCPVYKAGSTSMFHNLLLLGGFTNEQIKNSKTQVIDLAAEMYETQSMNLSCKTCKSEGIQQSIKLLVVRHPFERLLSYFTDKMANASVRYGDGTFITYYQYGRHIVHKYRTDPTIRQKEPTWEEFIKYILDTDFFKHHDDHWLPIFYVCTPCLVNYDIIAKLETFSRDQAYFIRKLELGTVLKEPSWQHRLNSVTEEKRKNTVRKYFGQLTKKQINALVSKYLMDFVLFDYDPFEYIAYGREG